MHPALARHVGSKQHKLHHRPLDSEWYYVKRYPVQKQIAWSTNSGTNFCISCTYHILVTTAPTTFLARTQKKQPWEQAQLHLPHSLAPTSCTLSRTQKTAVRTCKAKQTNNMSIRVQCKQIVATTEPLKKASVSHTKPRRVNPNGHGHKWEKACRASGTS